MAWDDEKTDDEDILYASDYNTIVSQIKGRILHSLATAENDMLVASGAGAFVKKTLAEVKTILGLGSAAYLDVGTASGDVAAGNRGLPSGGTEGQIIKKVDGTNFNVTWGDPIDADALVYKGAINCSTNPNYPAADAGDTYKVSAAGKIGGASGPSVAVGDLIICSVNSTASGDHATVGSHWSVIGATTEGGVAGPTSSIDGNFPAFSGTSGGSIVDSGTGPSSFLQKTLATAANLFLVSSAANTWAVKTIAEIKTLLGLGGAAYLDVGTEAGSVCAGDDARLSDSRTPTSHGNEAHSSTFLTEIDIHGATPETAIADDDEILIYDASASANRRMTRSNFLSGVPGYVDDIIGVKWDSSSSSPTLTRVDEDLQEISAGYINWPKYFNRHPIWGQMWRCNLTASGTPTFGTNARGDGLTLTDDYTMVRIPRTYHRFVYDDGDWYWLVSPEASSGFSLHPAFYQRGHSASPAGQVYVGSYNAHDAGSSKLGSKSGTTPLTNQTMATFESRGNNIGTGWGLMNFHTLCLLQMLFYIEYASFDSQSKVGPGRTNTANTGRLASGGAAAFERTNGTSVGTTDVQAVSWRGIENLWGNIWQWIPGYNTTDTSHRILKRDGTGTIADVMASGSYEEILDPIPLNGTTRVSGTDAGTYCEGYVSGFDRDSSNILGPMFIPGALLGASDQYLTDYFYSHQSGISQTGVLRAGGAWGDGAKVGVGWRNLFYRPAKTDASIGGRLEYIG